jgi:hypothetical protein
MELTRVPPAHRRTLIVCAIATAHFLLWSALFAMWSADTMARFDGRQDSGPATLLLKCAYETLSFPLITAFQLLIPANLGIWGWLVIASNSFAWGWVAWRGVRFWRARLAAPN